MLDLRRYLGKVCLEDEAHRDSLSIRRASARSIWTAFLPDTFPCVAASDGVSDYYVRWSSDGNLLDGPSVVQCSTDL